MREGSSRQIQVVPTDVLSDIVALWTYRTKRIPSWGRTGGNKDNVVVPKGGKHMLPTIEGPAYISIRNVNPLSVGLDRISMK